VRSFDEVHGSAKLSWADERGGELTEVRFFDRTCVPTKKVSRRSHTIDNRATHLGLRVGSGFFIHSLPVQTMPCHAFDESNFALFPPNLFIGEEDTEPCTNEKVFFHDYFDVVNHGFNDYSFANILGVAYKRVGERTRGNWQ
jgi:hypothetical protein